MQHSNANIEKTRKPARASSYGDAKSRREAEQRAKGWQRQDKAARAVH